MKKFSLLASVALMISTVVVSSANPFSDVTASHWAYDATKKLADKGLIQGFPDGEYKGEEKVSRYHLAMVIARILAKYENTVNDNSVFTKADVETLERLAVEFGYELHLIGFKTVKLEEDIVTLKEDVESVKKE